MAFEIKSISCEEISNSRGQATIEVSVKTEKGNFIASTPSGVSAGRHEAITLPAEQAKKNIKNIIAPAMKGKTFINQQQVDNFLIGLDGTPNKNYLGANAILAVSIACFRAFQRTKGKKSFFDFPRLSFNILEGGAHTKNNLSIQEFIVVPDLGNVKDNLKAGKKIYKALGKVLHKKFNGQKLVKGDEGGFALDVRVAVEALDYLMEAIEDAGYKGKAQIGIDVAASEFYQDGQYNFEGELRTAEDMSRIYQNIFAKYPILFIEDPFEQDDLSAWQKFRERGREFGFPIIVGDDLTTTNPTRIKEAREKHLCNAVVIKPNQIGTVSETIKAAKLAKSFGWKIMVSHRGGETMDSFIADLAIILGADLFKSGAPKPKERMAKYNRLIQIEKKRLNENFNEDGFR